MGFLQAFSRNIYFRTRSMPILSALSKGNRPDSFDGRPLSRFLTQRSFSEHKMQDVFILSAVRTPIGSFNGVLKDKSAVDLAAVAIAEAVKRSTIEPSEIEHVYMGHVLQAGCRQAPTRQAALKAGLPPSTEATSINKLCASGLKAITAAVQSLSLGDESIAVAGGMESMSQAPFILPRSIPKYGGQMCHDTIVYDGLTCAVNNIHMGSCTERLLKRYGLTREDQDKYAIESYQKSLHSSKSGVFDSEIVPVSTKRKNQTITIDEDEEPKKLVEDKIPLLKPVFEIDGTITAANASKLNDAAGALVLCSKNIVEEKKLVPLAKIIAYADGACEPEDFGRAPVVSILKVLKKADIHPEDIALWEINEAFSAVPLIVMKEIGIDSCALNVDGGAVSLGHPVGFSGARIVTHLVHRLKPNTLGLAAICNGGGGSTAIIIERL